MGKNQCFWRVCRVVPTSWPSSVLPGSSQRPWVCPLWGEDSVSQNNYFCFGEQARLPLLFKIMLIYPCVGGVTGFPCGVPDSAAACSAQGSPAHVSSSIPTSPVPHPRTSTTLGLFPRIQNLPWLVSSLVSSPSGFLPSALALPASPHVPQGTETV